MSLFLRLLGAFVTSELLLDAHGYKMGINYHDFRAMNEGEERDSAVSVNNRSTPQNRFLNYSFGINECAKPWRDVVDIYGHPQEGQIRWKCDQMLKQWMEQISPNGDDFTVGMALDTDGETKLTRIAGCYMSDPCYVRPRPPDTINGQFMPFPDMANLYYLSYDTWWEGLAAGWKRMQEWQGNLRKTFLIVPTTGGMAAGASGKHDPGFDPGLAQLPEMFYKSELWTHMHLIYYFRKDIAGVAFVGNQAHQRRLNAGDLAMTCDHWPPGSSETLPESHKCNMALAYDVTYSGTQLEADARSMFRTDGHGLLPAAFINSLPATRKLVLLGAAHNNWYQDMEAKQESMDYRTIVGYNLEPGYRGASGKIPGGLMPMLTPQFKIPDGVSLDTTVAEQLKVTLCCCGFETRRSNYKVYDNYRPMPCSTTYSCDALELQQGGARCMAVFGASAGAVQPPPQAVAGAAGQPTAPGVPYIAAVQERWRTGHVHERGVLFQQWDTNNSTRLSKQEFYAGMNAMFGNFSPEQCEQEWRVMCTEAPGCEYGNPNNEGVRVQEFKDILTKYR